LPAYYYDDEYFMAGMISRSDVFGSFWLEYCSRGKTIIIKKNTISPALHFRSRVIGIHETISIVSCKFVC